jgi:hypothetical protein
MWRAEEKEQEELYPEGRRKAPIITVSNYNNNSASVYWYTTLSNVFGDTVAGEYTATATYNKQVAEINSMLYYHVHNLDVR